MKLSIGPIKLRPNLMAIAGIATVVSVAIAGYGISQLTQRSSPPLAAPPAPVPQVSALGRLEPATEVVKIAAPLSLDGDRVTTLQVREGDRVQAGEIIAILSSRDQRLAELQAAQRQVNVNQARLLQIKAGAKSGEISAQSASIRRLEAQWQGERATQQASIRRLEAQLRGNQAVQEATIRKLEAELANATAEYSRYQQLRGEGAISESQFDSKRLSLETSRQELQEAKVALERIQQTGQAELQEAKANLTRLESTSLQAVRSANATLNQIAEVRPVDVEVVQAELEAAIATVQQAKINLDQTYIRSPMTGQILKIHTRQGEKIDTNGIVEMAETQNMMAIAEVYQSDIGKVRIGQPATIKGEAFANTLQGRVSLIKQQVSRQNVFSNQPGENLDQRVVEVKIRLNPEDSAKISHLTNLQVQVQIQVNPSSIGTKSSSVSSIQLPASPAPSP